MAIKRVIALTLTVTLAACAHPTVFDMPPGVDEAQFHRDTFECAIQAKRLVGDSFAFGPPLMIAAVQIRHDNDMKAAHDECMLGKSYTVHAQR